MGGCRETPGRRRGFPPLGKPAALKHLTPLPRLLRTCGEAVFHFEAHAEARRYAEGAENNVKEQEFNPLPFFLQFSAFSAPLRVSA
jgi:hypothetical protein